MAGSDSSRSSSSPVTFREPPAPIIFTVHVRTSGRPLSAAGAVPSRWDKGAGTNAAQQTRSRRRPRSLKPRPRRCCIMMDDDDDDEDGGVLKSLKKKATTTTRASLCL